MTGEGTGAEATIGGAPGATHGGVYGGPMQQLPIYDRSRRKDAHKNWKAEIKVFALAYNVPKEQLGPRIWLRLTKQASKAVEHLDIDTDIAVVTGVESLLKVLDKDVLQEDWNQRPNHGGLYHGQADCKG